MSPHATGSRNRSPNASQWWVIRNGWSQLTCGMLSRMKLAVLKMTTAIMAPIGCSVSVETNSPTAPREAKHSAEVSSGSEHPHAGPRAKPIWRAGEQRQVAAAEQQPGP